VPDVPIDDRIAQRMRLAPPRFEVMDFDDQRHRLARIDPLKAVTWSVADKSRDGRPHASDGS
jgi:hypothetical protein